MQYNSATNKKTFATSLTGVKNVYLAGPMEYAHNEGLNWRRAYERAFKAIGINCVIPNDEEKNIKRENDMGWLKEHNLPRYIEILREFIRMDLEFVETVDLVIVRWEGEQTAGTIHEVGKAYEIGKPAYLVTSLKPVDVPGWFLACFTQTFTSLKDLIKHVKQVHL